MSSSQVARPGCASRNVRGLVARMLVASALALTATSVALAEEDADETYAIGLWGDLPYSDLQASESI